MGRGAPALAPAARPEHDSEKPAAAPCRSRAVFFRTVRTGDVEPGLRFADAAIPVAQPRAACCCANSGLSMWYARALPYRGQAVN